MTSTEASSTADVTKEVVDLKIENDDDVVDPWTVTTSSETGINYDKLIGK